MFGYEVCVWPSQKTVMWKMRAILWWISSARKKNDWILGTCEWAFFIGVEKSQNGRQPIQSRVFSPIHPTEYCNLLIHNSPQRNTYFYPSVQKFQPDQLPLTHSLPKPDFSLSVYHHFTCQLNFLHESASEWTSPHHNIRASLFFDYDHFGSIQT